MWGARGCYALRCYISNCFNLTFENICIYFRNECLFGYELERRTNKTREPWFVCSVLRFIPNESLPPKKTHSLYLQCFHQRTFIKHSEKSYKFKFLLFTGTLNLIWWKSLRTWSAQLTNYLMTVFIGNWIENFRMVQWRKYKTIVNISE